MLISQQFHSSFASESKLLSFINVILKPITFKVIISYKSQFCQPKLYPKEKNPKHLQAFLIKLSKQIYFQSLPKSFLNSAWTLSSLITLQIGTLKYFTASTLLASKEVRTYSKWADFWENYGKSLCITTKLFCRCKKTPSEFRKLLVRNKPEARNLNKLILKINTYVMPSSWSSW